MILCGVKYFYFVNIFDFFEEMGRKQFFLYSFTIYAHIVFYTLLL